MVYFFKFLYTSYVQVLFLQLDETNWKLLVFIFQIIWIIALIFSLTTTKKNTTMKIGCSLLKTLLNYVRNLTLKSRYN